MARITWQNVAAPDLSTALAGTAAAGELFASAAEQFSGGVKSIASNNRRDASKRALDASLAYQDSAGWNQAMQTQGLGALGIAPEMATDEFLNYVVGKGDDLAGDERAAFEFQQAELAAARNEKAIAETDIADQMNSEALRMATDVARGTVSKEDAMRAVTSQGLAPDMEQLVLAALDSQPANRWAADGKFTGTAELTPEFGLAKSWISGQEADLNMNISNDPVLSLYTQATQNAAGYDNPVDGMIDRLRSRVDGSEEDTQIVNKSAGSLQGSFTDLTREFPGVPREIVAQVMENNLEQSWLGFGSELKPDMSVIRDELKAFSTPDQLMRLEGERQNIDKRVAENRETRELYDRAVEKYELGASRGGEAGQAMMDAAREEIAKLTELGRGSKTSDAEAAAAAAELEAAAAGPRGWGDRGTNPNGTQATLPPLNFGKLLDDAVNNPSVQEAWKRGNMSYSDVVNEGIVERFGYGSADKDARATMTAELLQRLLAEQPPTDARGTDLMQYLNGLSSPPSGVGTGRR